MVRGSSLKLALIAGLLSAVAFPQTPPPKFDLSSVKPNVSGCCTSGGFGNGQGGGRNVTLKFLIASAYNVQEFQISGGPGWIGSDRFDVEGRTEDRYTDPDRLRLMLQSLLEDQFLLKLHWEARESASTI